MSVYDNHQHAIDYRYRFEGPAAQLLAHLTTVGLVARIDASVALDPRRPMDWAAYRVLADRSGIAHVFEADYSRELEERYNAVREANPHLNPERVPGEPDTFQDAYDAYADAHPDILTPTARALAWAREQIKGQGA